MLASHSLAQSCFPLHANWHMGAVFSERNNLSGSPCVVRQRCFWKHTEKQQHHHLLSWAQLYSSTGNTVSSGMHLGQSSPSEFLLFLIHGHIIK